MLAATGGALALLGLVGCSSGADEAAEPVVDGATSCSYPASGDAAKQVDPPAENDVPAEGTVDYTLSFSAGDVTITMDRTGAPCTINSFGSLAEQGYFDDTECHRLTTEGIFVLQCGDPSATGRGGPGYSFADEQAGEYPAGTVAMANAGPDTNGSQFFLVYEDSPLPPDYTVLGTMDEESAALVSEIAAEGNDGSNGPGDGAPIADARITSVTGG